MESRRKLRTLKIAVITLPATFLLLTFATLAASAPSPDDATRDNDTKLVRDFQGLVNKYLEFRKNEIGSSPRPTNSPEKIAETQQQLASRLEDKRQNARQGDIFKPEIADYFRRQIAATLATRQGKKIRASLKHAEPVHGLSLQVNQVYPQGIPLQSTPPTLLLNLPTLPKELEYRIVGRNLVLYDSVPNVVVDFISDAIPSEKD
jgi:hypothetical protein